MLITSMIIIVHIFLFRRPLPFPILRICIKKIFFATHPLYFLPSHSLVLPIDPDDSWNSQFQVLSAMKLVLFLQWGMFYLPSFTRSKKIFSFSLYVQPRKSENSTRTKIVCHLMSNTAWLHILLPSHSTVWGPHFHSLSSSTEKATETL